MSPIQDELTGLSTRRKFIGQLRRALTLANERQQSLALLVVDLEGFSRINGAFGYAFGDQLLQHLADQLREVLRAQDVAGRIGGDRFALLLPAIMNAGHAELAVQKLFRLLDVPFRHGDHQLRVIATVGVALCPAHASHPDHLLRQAERAVARARAAGVRSAMAADIDETSALSRDWDIEIELDTAIERGQMSMHYQPQLRLSDLRPVGVEALMRWKSPTRGDIPPARFIPIAERTGQIKRLTIWALNTVLRQVGRWRHPWGDMDVSVNMPAELVAQQDLPDLVENAMRLWEGEGVRLVLEITERSLMDARHSIDVLTRIRALGAKVSIDDFGTGYSCLAVFKDTPADELKIDQSFVAAMADDPASRHIAQLMVDLAHRFGMRVVAEGIEDASTLEELRRMGCDIGQGFLLARPMSADAMQAWLRDQALKAAS